MSDDRNGDTPPSSDDDAGSPNAGDDDGQSSEYSDADLGKLKRWLPKSLREFDTTIKNIFVALRRGVGATFNSPDELRERANASAEARVIEATADGLARVAEATADKAIEEIKSAGGNPALALRSVQRVNEEVIRAQQNRERIASMVLEEIPLQHGSSDASKLVDDDWLTIFWNLAEKKSNAEIQRLYAKILTGEACNPGSFSPLTLVVLSTMTRKIAEQFEKFCRLSICEREQTAFTVFHWGLGENPLNPLIEFGISFDLIRSLIEHGLAADIASLKFLPEESPADWDIGGHATIAEFDQKSGDLEIVPFTNAGFELRRLIALTPNPEYMPVLLDHLESQGYNISFVTTSN